MKKSKKVKKKCNHRGERSYVEESLWIDVFCSKCNVLLETIYRTDEEIFGL